MRTILTGGSVFDGSGAAPASADVAIEDGRIVAVQSGLDGDRAVDCSGTTLVPGLIDCHVHIAWRTEDFDELAFAYRPFSYRLFAIAGSLRRTLECGITTIRDAGGADLGLKQALADGVLAGPRAQISVTMLSQTGGHADFSLPSGAGGAYDVPYPGMPSPLCDGVEGVTRKVREVVRAGADVVKLCTTGGYVSPSDDPHHLSFTEEELAAAVGAAADLGRAVMAHAHGAEGIKRAARAGCRSVEHGTFMDEEAAALMVERGTWLVPTLATGDATEELAADPALPETVRAKLTGVGKPELGAFRLAVDAGVKIAMGTDCPETPHGTNLRELELMAENGMSPAQALVAATASAAELLGLGSELGTLEPGKRADVVVVEGDALDFTRLRERIREVWMDGVPVLP
jgi:imidazolonepropionase-like amidohydrolase